MQTTTDDLELLTGRLNNAKYSKEMLSNDLKDGSFPNFRENVSMVNVKL